MHDVRKRQEAHRALPVGRILRFLLGSGLLVAVLPFFGSGDPNRLVGVLLVVVALSIFYGLLHWLVSSALRRLHRWLGAVLAILPALVVFVFGGMLGQIGVATFLAASLLLAAIRADGGCEVMSIPGLVLGRQTHLVCLLFSPVDWLERKIAGTLEPMSK